MSGNDNFYDFLSEIFKLTGYGDFSENGFTSRWIKTNNSLIRGTCMTYLKRYFSSKNCVTGAQLHLYRKITRDKRVEESKVEHLLSAYFEEEAEQNIYISDDVIPYLESEVKLAEGYLRQLELIEETICKELISKDNEIVHYAGRKKAPNQSSDVRELNTLHSEVVHNLYEYLGELCELIIHNKCDEPDVDINTVEKINSEVIQNFKLFLKKAFPQEVKREEVNCDITAHQKLLDIGVDLTGLRCKNTTCVPKLILELKGLHDSKLDLEYGKHLLRYRKDETSLCLEESMKFIKNAEDNAFLLSASEMRLITQDNKDKIVILENITKEFYSYMKNHFHGSGDFFVKILKEKLSFKNNEFEFYANVLQKLVDVAIEHTTLNKAIVFLASLKTEKFRSATELCSKVDQLLNDLYNDHYIRVSALNKKKEQYDGSKKRKLLKLQQLADLCQLDITVDEKRGVNSIMHSLRNKESEMNEFVFSVAPAHKLNEVYLLERDKEELNNIVFNGPMMQPISVDINTCREKEQVKMKLEELMGRLSIVQSDYKDGLENTSDDISWIVGRTLWAIFLTDPDKMKELYDNLEEHLFKC